MPIPSSYKESGVDTSALAIAKKGLQRYLEEMSKDESCVRTPYHTGRRLPSGEIVFGGVDGIGTKQLLAVLMNRNDVTSWDIYGMLADDMGRPGARAVAMGDYLASEGNPSEQLTMQLGKGFNAAYKKCGVPILFGETSSVKDVVRSLADSTPKNKRKSKYMRRWLRTVRNIQNYDLACFCIGIAKEDELITGKEIRPNDHLVGYWSSGPHLNGYTWLRRLLKFWGGPFDFFEVPEGYTEDLQTMLLKPKEIYYPIVRETIESGIKVKGFHHNTGDALKKMDKLMEASNVGFLIDNPPLPQQIFQLTYETIAKQGKPPELAELYGYLNMGIGGIVVVNEKDSEKVIAISKKHGTEAQRIGIVTEDKSLVVRIPSNTEFPSWLRNQTIQLI